MSPMIAWSAASGAARRGRARGPRRRDRPAGQPGIDVAGGRTGTLADPMEAMVRPDAGEFTVRVSGRPAPARAGQVIMTPNGRR